MTKAKQKPKDGDINGNSETEKCLITSMPPTRKVRCTYITVCTFLTIFAFVTGLVTGFFTNNPIYGNSKAAVNRSTKTQLKPFLNFLDKEEIGRNIRYFSSEPHLAGSRRSKELADEIRRRWVSYGFHVDTVKYDVLLPQAKDDSPDYMEVKDKNGHAIMKHVFAAQGKSDPKNNKTWSIPRFFFYSPPGSVEGGLLYVNQGRKQDFEYLKKVNVTSCDGSVVLMKIHNYLNIPEKLRNAYDCNATGVLIFNQQTMMRQTSGNSSAYPNGIRLPKEQPLAFNLRNDWDLGDPLTPNLPASDGIYRLEDIDWPAKLPAQLVDYNFATKLLQLLEGSPIPKEWKWDNTPNYRIGPTLRNNSTLQLTVNSKAERTEIYDIIGTVYGEEEPDSWVLLGNHRDAITFGGADAGSGTTGMLELSRAIGELLKKGWKPRRTIKLCSWAAEEMGIIGAMEYVQDNKKLLEERAVAYINMDMLVHGNDSLKAIGNPMTRELVYAQSKKVSDPHGPDETIYSVWKRARPDLTKKDLPQYCTAGFGSDYIPFYEIAGVPSIDLQYGKVPYGSPQFYHTVYDTYHMITMFDPHFMFHLAQTKLAARILYELANSPLIPFNINSFTSSLREIVSRTKSLYETELQRHGITLNGISKEVKELSKAGWKFEQIKNQTNPTTSPDKVRMLNRRMVAFNKLFISPEPLPGRFDLRNLVLGISQNFRYPDITLAGVSDAVIAANTSGKWDIVKRQVSLTHHAITQARRSLEIP